MSDQFAMVAQAGGKLYHHVTKTNLSWPRKVVGQSLCGAINLTQKAEGAVETSSVCKACMGLVKHVRK